ncbi:MAG: hypothetical protein LQ339_005404 [Xanthoria mediterranea]|nr:MAG: hypothetical protein LQ339_005404 [Xanthoria mediterranea]
MNTNPAALAREAFQPAQNDSNPPVVEKVKETLGMASNSQSGTEPVSGETGEGTVEQPFDQGNKEGKSGAASDGAGGKGTEGI